MPLPTKSVIIQIGCNNLPDRADGNHDVRIHEITYADGGRSKNRLLNGEFDSGLYNFVVYGTGTVTTPKGDPEGGRSLRLRASRDQEIIINSFGFPVKAGSNYTMNVRAAVPPDGSVACYVAAIFMWGDGEGYRETLFVVAPPIAGADLVTGADGSLNLDAAVPAGRYRVRLDYAGDATHLPVTTELEVTVS